MRSGRISIRVCVAIAFSAFCAAGILYSARVLQARGPVTVYAGLMAVYVLVSITARRGVARATAHSLFALALGASFLWILITPATAYSAWFLLVDRGMPQGSVSFVMILVGWTGLCHVLVAFADRPLVLVSAASAWSLFMVSVILQSHEWLLLAVSMTLFSLIVSRPLRARERVVHAAVLLGVFAIAGGVGLSSPWWASARGSRIIDTRISPALRSMVVRIWPEFPLLAGLSESGSGFAAATLSGTPLLTDNPVLELTPAATEAVYIRGRVFDTYSNGSWFTSISAVNRFDAISNEQLVPSWIHTPVEPGDSVRSIEILAEFIDAFPYPADYPLVEVSAGTASDHEHVLTASEMYTVRSLNSRAAYQDLDSRDLQVYQAVPESIVRVLSSFVTDAPDHPRETLQFIRETLRYGAAYSLVRLEPPGGVDPLVYFLRDNRSGFCIHFASAAVILSRMHGLPARYVTGFLVPPTRDSDTTRVLGTHAHAWAEVWIDGAWQIFETTPGPGAVAEPSVGMPGNVSRDPLTQRQLSAFGMQLHPVPGVTGERSVPSGFFGVVVATGILLLFVLYRLYGARRSHEASEAAVGGPRYAQRLLFPDPDRLAHRAQRQLRRIVRRSGDNHPSRVGWNGWARAHTHAAPDSPRLRRRARTVARLAHELFYRSGRIRKRDLSYLRRVRISGPT